MTSTPAAAQEGADDTCAEPAGGGDFRFPPPASTADNRTTRADREWEEAERKRVARLRAEEAEAIARLNEQPPPNLSRPDGPHCRWCSTPRKDWSSCPRCEHIDEELKCEQEARRRRNEELAGLLRRPR